jgi:hypothetical protein
LSVRAAKLKRVLVNNGQLTLAPRGENSPLLKTRRRKQVLLFNIQLSVSVRQHNMQIAMRVSAASAFPRASFVCIIFVIVYEHNLPYMHVYAVHNMRDYTLSDGAEMCFGAVQNVGRIVLLNGGLVISGSSPSAQRRQF